MSGSVKLSKLPSIVRDIYLRADEIGKMIDRAYSLGMEISKIYDRLSKEYGNLELPVTVRRDCLVMGAGGILRISNPRNFTLRLDAETRIQSASGDANLSYIFLPSGTWIGLRVDELGKMGKIPIASWMIISDTELARDLLSLYIPDSDVIQELLKHVEKMREIAEKMLKLDYMYRKAQREFGSSVLSGSDVRELVGKIARYISEHDDYPSWMVDACWFLHYLDEYLHEYCKYAEKLINVLTLYM